MRTVFANVVIAVCSVILSGCARAAAPPEAGNGPLIGAWHSKIVFSNGPLTDMKGLQFLYAYNAGGTMTESSNYDEAANSSPPAYGIWKRIDARTFATKYMFFTTRTPAPGDGATNGNDWWPDGHGIINEKITLSADGQTYASTITLNLFDRGGAPIASHGEGIGAGVRIGF